MAEWKTRAFAELATPLGKVVGADSAKAFLALGCETLGDLLHLVPRHLMSGTDLTDIKVLIDNHMGSDEFVALVARVAKVERKGDPPKERLEVRLTDGSNWVRVTFFGQRRYIDYWERFLRQEGRGIFAGKLTWFAGTPQLANPAFVMLTDGGYSGPEKNFRIADRVRRSSFVGIYPQTAKLPTWAVAETMEVALARVIGMRDPLPTWIRERLRLPSLEAAFHNVHEPQDRSAYELGKKRLLFDEAFATQVAMAYRRADASRHTAQPRQGRSGGIAEAFDARLPFQLTDDQLAVGETLAAELAGARPMQRLLQGEVGSGKTVVALRAMLRVVDAGGQAVLMAPTEVLAQQHAYTIAALMGDLAGGALLRDGPSTDVVLLTGSMTAPAKGQAAERIASGQAGIVIGTHALLSSGIRFHDLGLVVVDEQHRFGVEQRNALAATTPARPHVLVMTATPIPRSVAMTIFGDLDLSTLTRVPPGRAGVTTTVVDVALRPAWVDRAWQRAREEVGKGRQVYIVAPRIDSTEGRQGASVVDLAKQLAAGPLQGLRLAVLHGRLPAGEKTDIMARFSAGQIDVLVATSLIEVGLDQPGASMMVIMDAERFGISQLHQLRGRIGRGSYPGVCLLLTGAPEESPARRRLAAVAATRDGFELAQADLAQRREGDVLGMTQAGRRTSLRLLRVIDHADIIEMARGVAREVVEGDPDMTDPGIADYVAEIESRSQAELDEAT